MILRGLCSPLGATCVAASAFAWLLPATATATVTATASVPAPAASSEPARGALPLLGRVRAVTPFCRLIVDHAASLAEDQLADIRTTTEALRLLAYAPLDSDIFTEHRAVHVLETLATRLMMSRRGDAKVHVAGLRKAARGTIDEAPRPELARFAGALDGAHSESSRVAHEISRALSVLEDVGAEQGGVYLPDYGLSTDPRFAAAETPVPFPVDADLERFPAGKQVQNGPLHAYAREVALTLSDSLQQMLSSIDEAKHFFPAAFGDCADYDPQPSASASPAASAPQ